MAELDAVSVEGEHWAELPSATRELFRFLRDAATRNPLSKDHGGATTTVADARELLGMTREALHAMVERLCDARDREAENRADRAVAGEPASWTRRLADFLGSAPPPPPPPPPPSREEQLLRQQADRVRSLELYLHAQEDALATLIGGASTAAGGGDGGGGGFVPTYEYQELADDVTTLPPGLQVDLPLDGSPRRARIPPRWTLSVWVSRGRGYFRTEVTRATTVGELDARLRAWAGPASVGAELHFRGGARLGARPGATVEEVGLFGRARDVEACGVAEEEEEEQRSFLAGITRLAAASST